MNTVAKLFKGQTFIWGEVALKFAFKLFYFHFKLYAKPVQQSKNKGKLLPENFREKKTVKVQTFGLDTNYMSFYVAHGKVFKALLYFNRLFHKHVKYSSKFSCVQFVLDWIVHRCFHISLIWFQ